MTDYNKDEAVKKELDDIRLTVHRLEATKQNKWPMPLIITMVIWCASVTAGGSWWAATMTEQLSRLEQTVAMSAGDRYRSRDAAQDFALRDQITQFLENRVDDNEKHLIQLESEVDKLRDEVRGK